MKAKDPNASDSEAHRITGEESGPIAAEHRRVLFVDDEPRVLEALELSLYRQRRDWDMVFRSSGEAALDELDRQAFDVVVADLSMPGMDGYALLRHVQHLHPSAARIAVSGQVALKTVLDAVPVAQQFLSKPFDAPALRGAIERACDLRRRLAGRSVQDLIGGVGSLPSPPTTYFEILRLAAMPEVGLDKIAAVLASDAAMTAKVLHVVNSAFFGFTKRVTSIKHAAVVLGVEVLKALALSAHVFTPPQQPLAVGFSLDELQGRSLAAARLARSYLADRRQADEAFTAALVADIGQIVLAMGRSTEYGLLLARAAASRRPLHELEEESLGVSRAEVGSFLLGMWGLPAEIVEVVAYHHRPPSSADVPANLLAAVHVACALVDAERSGKSPEDAAIDRDFLARVGFEQGASTMGPPERKASGVWPAVASGSQQNRR